MTEDTKTRTDAIDADGAPDSHPQQGRTKRILGGFLNALQAIKAHPLSFLMSILCLGICLLLMANAEQITRGPLLGLGFLMLGVLSLMSTFGLFDPDENAADLKQSPLGQLPGEPAWMSARFGVPAAALILIGGAFGLGYDYAPAFILLAHAALLPAAIRRPGLMVFTIVSAIYLPLLGTTSLWDPWETHYGEVAREIIERDDWISLWWAQENWFWSKPILIFWTEALSLGFFGVDTSPHAHPMHPEWAIRMPAYLFSIAATLTSYAAIRRVFGMRAGVLSALVLATAPHFFMLAHQAITDMFLVSNIVMAMCMLILAVSEEPERAVKRYRLGRFTVSGQHALIFGLMMIALPQIFYLLTRNISFLTGDQFGFALHGDEFLYGSAGNDGVPGNAAHQQQRPAYPGLQPALQGLAWLLGLFFLLRMLLRERRARALYMFAFYGFCALAFMGKGIPGFALPGMIALLFLIGARRWDLLLEGQLRIAPGALMVAVTGLPWYVAMYVRHGAAFTNRLLIHDHINRLTLGVHGDTGSIQYFIWQLGYATFPWVGLIPVSVLVWLWYRRSQAPTLSLVDDRPRRSRQDTLTLIALWFFGAFTLFSAMKTKFHHYIFPTVPPAALMVGIFLDRLMGSRAQTLAVEESAPEVNEDDASSESAQSSGFAWRPVWGALLCILAPLGWVTGVAALWGNLRGIIPEDVPAEHISDWVLNNGPDPIFAWVCIALGFAALFLADRLIPKPLEALSATRPSAQSAALGAMLLFAAVIVAFVGRDLSWVTDGRPQGYERIIHLFVYNYGRLWPEQFDFRPVFTGFAIVAGTIIAVAALQRFRHLMARALVGLALLFATWTLNVYMIDLSPHWGMRTVIHRYYELRPNEDVPLISWQMNWKGENFYSGNGTYVFVNLDNQAVREWIDENDGSHAFFVTEYSRLGGLRSLLAGREFTEVTTKRECNKFIMIEVPEL